MYTPHAMLASRLALPAAGSAPTAADAAQAASGAIAARPTELVTRPDGLRRGAWEGPSWIFVALAGLVVLVVLVWGLRKLRALRRGSDR